MSALILGLVVAAGAIARAPGDDEPLRVEIPLVGANSAEVDLADLVTKLAAATGLKLAPPAAGVTLPMTGIAGGLSQQTIAAALGPDARMIAVEGHSLIVDLDRIVLKPDHRADWEGRLRELTESAGREARRRLKYGMHALPSYRPNDPARPTVCLVHGINSSSRGFVHLIPHLEEAGFGVVVYEYPYNRKLADSSRQFARDWLAFRAAAGETRKWALVGHSMGNLLARDYLEGPAYAGDVSTFVMLAPVNHGSNVAKTQTLMQMLNSSKAVSSRKATDALAHLGDGLGQAANDLLPGSGFLKTLNARPRRGGVAYHILAGDAAFIPRAVRAQLDPQVKAIREQGGVLGSLARMTLGEDLSPDRLDEITDGAGDGCVSVESTKLAGVTDHVVIHVNHAELIRAPLLFVDDGPVACMPHLLRWLGKPGPG